MDLLGGSPWWPIADRLPAAYPALDRDIRHCLGTIDDDAKISRLNR